MKIVIVIPTYNEAENIGNLIDVLECEFKKRPDDEWHILVVEGNSPDDTAKIVNKKAEVYPNVHLLMEEKKNGLGAAYLYGFRHALATFDPDVLVEMDADFQHDPKDITRLIEPLDKNYDYVIGSRYIKGGSIPQKWAFHRKLISWGGNIFTKVMLGMFSVSDFTSGFKASRVRGFVNKMDLTSTLSGGFAYKLDLLFKMHKLGARIKEIPIQFGIRDRGISKMENNNLLDSLKVVVLLRLNASKAFFRFLGVGLTGLAVDAGLFNLLRLSISSVTAALISGALAMITTFTLNNLWSFSDRKITSAQKRFFSMVVYAIFSAVPILIRSQLIKLVINTIGNTFLVVNTAFLIGIIIGLIWNFTVYNQIIWKQPKK